MPAFLRLNDTSLNIFGDDFSDSWNYYEVKVVLTDARSSLVNSDYTV